jgi:nicotinate phosphoribosyltransferase
MGDPLLQKIMEKGELTYTLPTLKEIREMAAENVSKLPRQFKVLTNAPAYPVAVSQKLQHLTECLKQQITLNEINH